MSESGREPLLLRQLAWLPFAMPLWIALLVMLTLVGNVVAWLGLGILPDEAYYWVWSQRLEWSYFDHPPLIGWLMMPGANLFGHEIWAVRLPAVLSWVIGVLVGYHMAQRIFGGVAGALAVLAWCSLPIVQAGFHIATPDSALMIFTWLGLWSAWRAGVEPDGPRWWLLTGLFLGLSLLAKYPAVLLLGALFFALLGSGTGRRWLKSPWPWFGALLALVLFLPVVWWNAQHEWISFRFQLGHGIEQKAHTDTMRMLWFFLGGQLGVAMPWTLLAMSWSVFSRSGRALDSYTRGLLGWGFWLPMIVFGLAGLTAKSGPNWTVTAYAAGVVLLAGLLNSWLYREGVLKRWWLLVVVPLFVLTVIAVNFLRFPQLTAMLLNEKTPPQRTQLSRALGWELVAPELQALLAQQPRPDECHLLADNHARAGMVAWLLQMPGRVDTTMQGRPNQYTLWREELVGPPPRYCLYVAQYDYEKGEREVQIPLTVQLPEGDFRRERIVTADNSDGSLRWYAIYRNVEE